MISSLLFTAFLCLFSSAPSKKDFDIVDKTSTFSSNNFDAVSKEVNGQTWTWNDSTSVVMSRDIPASCRNVNLACNFTFSGYSANRVYTSLLFDYTSSKSPCLKAYYSSSSWDYITSVGPLAGSFTLTISPNLDGRDKTFTFNSEPSANALILFELFATPPQDHYEWYFFNDNFNAYNWTDIEDIKYEITYPQHDAPSLLTTLEGVGIKRASNVNGSPYYGISFVYHIGSMEYEILAASSPSTNIKSIRWTAPFRVIYLETSNLTASQMSYFESHGKFIDEDLAIAYHNSYHGGYVDGSELDPITAQNTYNRGYADGIEDANKNGQALVSIFSGALDIAFVPINFFLGIFNFELFGINFSSVITALLTIALVIIVIRFISGSGGGSKDA